MEKLSMISDWCIDASVEIGGIVGFLVITGILLAIIFGFICIILDAFGIISLKD